MQSSNGSRPCFHFARWAHGKLHYDIDFSEKIIFSNEVHFHLWGYVNKQNCRIWCSGNPHMVLQKPMQRNCGAQPSLVRFSLEIRTIFYVKRLMVMTIGHQEVAIWHRSIISCEALLKKETTKHLKANIRDTIADKMCTKIGPHKVFWPTL